MQLIDIWRHLNPVERQYTYYSPPHDTFSRIDYVLGTSATLNAVESTEIHGIALSDHAPVTLSISNQHNKLNRKTWRFPSYLAKQENFQTYLHNEWEIYKDFNDTPGTSPSLFWEADKAFLRGNNNSLHYPLQKRKRTRIPTSQCGPQNCTNSIPNGRKRRIPQSMDLSHARTYENKSEGSYRPSSTINTPTRPVNFWLDWQGDRMQRFLYIRCAIRLALYILSCKLSTIF